jgi:NIMA-interacting peptidyl-prolyl cis-trans isomerase 4
MAPKNNAKGGDKKGKGKDASEGDKGKGGGKGLKPATSINVRHILVRKSLSLEYCFAQLHFATAIFHVSTSRLMLEK